MKIKNVLLKIGLGILIFLVVVCLLALLYRSKLRASYTNLERVDEAGKMYYMDYVGNYDSPLIELPLQVVKPVKTAGCSVFATKGMDNSALTCRNYDLAHLDDEGKPTGLNVMMKCSPEGKYKSIAVADAAWISSFGLPYYAGALDNGKTETMLLAFMPYLCMDGMNEKGFSVSILALDLKEGEHAVYQNEVGKKDVMMPILLRYMLDQCATVEEAVELAQSYNVVNTIGDDFHLFISDATGVSAVLEWRFDQMKVVYTDIVTNFYVGDDDAEDCYWDGELKEVFVRPKKVQMDYHYGYGHGYERFGTLAEILDGCRVSEGGKTWTQMSMEDAKAALEKVSQEYTGGITSLTQYSAIYNATELGVDIWVYPNYEKVYHMDLE